MPACRWWTSLARPRGATETLHLPIVTGVAAQCGRRAQRVFLDSGREGPC